MIHVIEFDGFLLVGCRSVSRDMLVPIEKDIEVSTRVTLSHRKTLSTLPFLSNRISSYALNALFTFATWPEVFIFSCGSNRPQHSPSPFPTLSILPPSIPTSWKIIETKEQFSPMPQLILYPVDKKDGKLKCGRKRNHAWNCKNQVENIKQGFLIKLPSVCVCGFWNFISSRILHTLRKGQWILQERKSRSHLPTLILYIYTRQDTSNFLWLK